MDVNTALKGRRPYRPATPAELASGNALTPGSRLREFEILDTLGEGGFSIVYAARDLKLNRDVAIKEYIPVSLAGRTASSTVQLRSEHHRDTFEAGLHGFINEARLLAQFKHPALVEVLQFWEENETAYMVMPRYSGRTLRSVLRSIGPRCDERWLRGMIAPVLDVLEMLHSRNVFHRDVAPDNVLIKNDGTPVLLDLGSAREVVAGLQKTITVVVKPGYAPIEQYSSDFALPQGPWTDIYAIGALLHFAITGTAPPASITRIMKDGLHALADAPMKAYSREFLAAIDSALALYPNARPQSIAQLRNALRITPADRTVVAFGSTAAAVSDSAATDADMDEDDVHTAIVSAAEVAEMVQQLAGHAAAGGIAQRTAANAGLTVEHAAASDPFDNNQPASVQPSQRFSDVEDLLSGRAVIEQRRISVPVVHDLREAAQSVPIASARAQSGWLLSVIALGLFGVLATIVYMYARHDDRAVNAGLWANVVASAGAERAPIPGSPYPVTAPLPPSGDPSTAESAALTSLAATAVADAGIGMPEASHPAASPSLPEPPQRATDLAVAADVSNTPASPASAEPNRANLPKATTAAAATAQWPARSAAATPAVGTSHPVTQAQAEMRASTSNRPSRDIDNEVKSSSAGLTATIQISVQPWAEIWLDGARRGISPPVHALQLAPGSYSLELRNPGLAPYRQRITVKANEPITVEHRFAVGAGGGS